MERKELHHRLDLLLASISFLERRIREQTCCKIPTYHMVAEMVKIRMILKDVIHHYPIEGNYWWDTDASVDNMLKELHETHEAVSKLVTKYPRYPQCKRPSRVGVLTNKVAQLEARATASDQRIRHLEDAAAIQGKEPNPFGRPHNPRYRTYKTPPQ